MVRLASWATCGNSNKSDTEALCETESHDRLVFFSILKVSIKYLKVFIGCFLIAQYFTPDAYEGFTVA